MPRLGTPNDVAQVATVLQQSFEPFRALYTELAYGATVPSLSVLADRFGEGPTWVIEHERIVVATLGTVPKEYGLYLRGMGVAPGVRRSGLGRSLLRAAEDYAIEHGLPRLYLSTTPFLTAAIRLYEAWGFIATDREPHELFGTPLFTMEKQLGR